MQLSTGIHSISFFNTKQTYFFSSNAPQSLVDEVIIFMDLYGFECVNTFSNAMIELLSVNTKQIT